MSIINKPPEVVKREYELQEPIAVAVEKYAAFIQSTSDHVVNSALKMVLWRDVDFRRWRKQQQTPLTRRTVTVRQRQRERDPRILQARTFLACVLAAATGMALYFRAPFPDTNLFLHVMAIRSQNEFWCRRPENPEPGH
jgi:hypothetical protein